MDFPAADAPAYGSFLARFHALVVDSLVTVVALVTILLLVELTNGVPGTGRIGMAAIVAFVLLYEPLMVAYLGGTVGHRRANLRVVHERTGERPGFGRAFARFALKSALGVPSFVLMALTRRHQALHDRMTDTTVRIHDLRLAPDFYVAWERPVDELEPVGAPSRIRRTAAIVAYLVMVSVAVVVLQALLVSATCNLGNSCTRRDDLTTGALSLGWPAASAYVLVAGWRGRLWGCRPRAGELTPDTSLT
ncbi:MAG TPA: RDD family protein [Gemmatimonadaceae bacterium]|nr:RDD family protein [Gemmatimonadaceae bacterium]